MTILSSFMARAQARVSNDVADEQTAQLMKWGLQSHFDGTGANEEFGFYLTGSETYGQLADFFTNVTDDRLIYKEVTWKDILLEEVFEALAEDDLDKLYTELKQTAAVCMSWMRDIKTRSIGGELGE